MVWTNFAKAGNMYFGSEEEKHAVRKRGTDMGEAYRVLLVDDNLINREVAAALLEDYGFALTQAQSGAEAVELVKRTKFQMIFMDQRMPGMDGVEAVRIIRGECGENGRLPVIVALSADASAESRDRFLREGFQDIIPKPLDRQALAKLLDRWCQGVSPKSRGGETSGDERMEDIRIDGVDIGEAKKHHTGGAENYVALLRLYCMDGRRKLTLLTQLLKSGDYETYGVEAHGLKSASANIGAMALSALAKDQEEAAKRKDTARIAGTAGALLEEYAGQLQRIEAFLERRDRDAKKEEKKACLENGEVLSRIREALGHLENFRSRESAGIVDALLKYGLESSVEAELKEIKERLALYEDDEAEELLRGLAARLEKED